MMTHFKRILIQILVILTLFVGMLAVLGREKLADENVQPPIPFGKSVARGWSILVAPENGESQPPPTPVPAQDEILCAYQWASRPLPEISSALQEEVNSAGIENTAILAEAFGEDCIDPASGNVIRFLTMQTDIRIHTRVNQISDRESAGRLLAQYLEFISDIPPETLPGRQPGMIEIVFTASDGEFTLWFPLVDGENALIEGNTGADLISALQD
jgi:hypothetical protein